MNDFKSRLRWRLVQVVDAAWLAAVVVLVHLLHGMVIYYVDRGPEEPGVVVQGLPAVVDAPPDAVRR